MMENFHHIFSTLSRLKISCLDKERREAKHKYTDHLQSYVITSLGQPLEKLNVMSHVLGFKGPLLRKVFSNDNYHRLCPVSHK